MSPLNIKVKDVLGFISEINDPAAQAVESNRLILKGKSSSLHWPLQNQYSIDDRAVIEKRKPIFRCEKSRFLDRELDVLVGKFPAGLSRRSLQVVAVYYFLDTPRDFYAALRESGAVQNPRPATPAHRYSVLMRPIYEGISIDAPYDLAECQLIQRNLTIGEASSLLRFLRPAAREIGYLTEIADNSLASRLNYEATAELRKRFWVGQQSVEGLGFYKQGVLAQLKKRYFPV